MTRSHLLAALRTLAILAACTIPGEDLPAVDIVSIDKVAHFAVFAVFGWLWMQALQAPLRRRAVLVLGAGIAFAILTEVYQGLLPWERTPDVADAVADALGAAAAVALYRRRAFSRKKPPSG